MSAQRSELGYRRPRIGALLLCAGIALLAGSTWITGSAVGTAGAVDATRSVPVTKTSASHITTISATTRSTGRPAANEPILLLMDTSSSMEETNGTSATTRLTAAKQAVNAFIDDLPTETPVGLDTYPSDGDCGEGTTQIPIDLANTEDMARYVRGMTADGNTPTGAALRKAAQDLSRYSGKAGVIVLVSDGESNCEGSSEPPCDVAKDLAKQGFDLTVNTVGLQISDAGRTELQCIADATAGTYVDVTDPGDLGKALTPIAVPQLTMKVSYPKRVVVVPGTNDSVTIDATVTNTGQALAPDVQATITYDATFSPGSTSPRRRLGNLAPGEKSEFQWTFRPSDVFKSQTVKFTAIATTLGRQTTPIVGAIAFQPPGQVDGFPVWLKNVDNIIVLGDSYSSGEGAGTDDHKGDIAFDAGSDEPYNSCHRSTKYGYAQQLVGVIGTKAKVINLACSGAVTWDFWDNSEATRSQRGDIIQRVPGTRQGVPLSSQRDQLVKLLENKKFQSESTVIMMTMGGNNVQFQRIIERCLGWNFVRHILETRPAYRAAKWLGMYDFGTCATGKLPGITPAEEIFRSSLGKLDTELPNIYRETERIFYEKTKKYVPILVPQYPAAFPENNNSYCRPDSATLFAREDRGFLNYVAHGLNGKSQRAATAVRTKEHLPVWSVETTQLAFQNGHTYCDGNSWVNRLTFENIVSKLSNQGVNVMSTMPANIAANPFGALDAFATQRFLQDTTARHGWQNMMHPNSEGYHAEAVAIANWANEHPKLNVPNGQIPISLDDTTVPSMAKSDRVVAVGTTSTAKIGPGQVMTLSADKFAPYSTVSIEIRSTPEPLVTVTADARGQIIAPVALRKDFPLGTHHLVVSGIDAKGKPLTYQKAVSVVRPLPVWWLPGAVAALIALIAGACCGFMLARSRRRPCASEPVALS